MVKCTFAVLLACLALAPLSRTASAFPPPSARETQPWEIAAFGAVHLAGLEVARRFDEGAHELVVRGGYSWLTTAFLGFACLFAEDDETVDCDGTVIGGELGYRYMFDDETFSPFVGTGVSLLFNTKAQDEDAFLGAVIAAGGGVDWSFDSFVFALHLDYLAVAGDGGFEIIPIPLPSLRIGVTF